MVVLHSTTTGLHGYAKAGTALIIDRQGSSVNGHCSLLARLAEVSFGDKGSGLQRRAVVRRMVTTNILAEPST